jgi:hypothetical protein
MSFQVAPLLAKLRQSTHPRDRGFECNRRSTSIELLRALPGSSENLRSPRPAAFITKSWFGSVTARYSDLRAISRSAVRANGVLNTNVSFATQSGEGVTMTRESIGRTDKIAQLLDYSCESLARTWMKSLDHQKEVVWIAKGSSSILRIRKDGVVFQGNHAGDNNVKMHNTLRLIARSIGHVETIPL